MNTFRHCLLPLFAIPNAPRPSVLMPRTTELTRHQALTIIDAVGVAAQALLARAEHDTMKHHVREALRDLDEAVVLLQANRPTDQAPWQIAAASYRTEFATARLRFATWALETYGPGVMMMG